MIQAGAAYLGSLSQVFDTDPPDACSLTQQSLRVWEKADFIDTSIRFVVPGKKQKKVSIFTLAN